MANPVDEIVTVEESPPPESSGPFKVTRVAWRHKGLVVLGVGIGLVLGLLFYVQAPRAYQSSAQVLVVKKKEHDLPIPGSEGRSPVVEDYLSTHQVIIRSPLIINKAVEKQELARLKALEGRENPAAAIADSLGISREMRNNNPTNILNITFRGHNPDDCGVVLNAVIDSYRDFLKSTYRNVTDETAKLITQAREVLETRLAKQEREYKKFRLEHPLLWKGKDGVNVLQERLINIETKRSALLIRQTEIEGSLASFERALKEKHSRADLLAMVSESARRLASDGGASKAVVEDPLTVLKLQEESLLDEVGPDHPKVQAVRRRIAALQARSSLAGKAGAEDVQPLDPVQAHLQALRRERDDAKNAAAALANLLAQEQEQAKELIGYENQDDAFRKEISRSQQLFDSVSKRLQEVNLLKEFGGFEAQVIAPAGPGKIVSPKPVPIFSIAAFLGLLAGFALAYLAELSDHSFRTPEEIRRRLGLPVVGHIPHFVAREEGEAAESDGPALAPALCTVHRSKSREAEAYRGVRTALYFASRGQHQVVQITSPDMGDGKTTLVANLAVSIAQTGKRVVLVDADFRRPRVHKLFDVSAERGMASVIAGEAELADVVQPSAVPGLFLLPCGPIPDNPAEQLTQPQFKELLDVLRKQYDFVLVDTPPLLAVTDPCVVVPNVDGVLLTIRISKNARPHAQRAKEILATLGAKVLGIVVNGVGRDAGGYGYDGYRYGYSYKSYSYYSYEDQNAAYYEPDGAEGGGQQAGGPRRRHGASGNGRRKGRGLLRRLFNL
jgi:capsular exopolysaccharide synthesis family protein